MITKVCRKCRREGKKLFLKGSRCSSSKCSFTRRSYSPGIHGIKINKKISEYAKQLREKQKAKATYGIRENSFKNYYLKSSKSKQSTGEKLLEYLETRLDNVIYLASLVASHRQAKQIISHKKVLVNGKRVNISSYKVKARDIIEIVNYNIKPNNIDVPVWLKLDKKNLKIEVIKIPSRSDIRTDIDEQLIVEFYSR